MKDSRRLPNRPKHSRDLTLTRSNDRRPILEAVLVCCALAGLLLILRAPTARLGLVYYDDGETLYHTLSLISGKIPYRDDYSHHFLGYILPFVLAAKAFGFSLDLVREVAFFTQLITALGVFLSMRLLLGLWPSAIAAGVTLALHQPSVWGFYQQYEINLFTAFIFYFSLRFCLSSRFSFLNLATLLAGIGFTFDQRASMLLFIPLGALYLQRLTPSQLIRQFSLLVLCFGTPSAFALAYLAHHSALGSFWQQTVVYPFFYRAASLSSTEIFKTWLSIHADLIRDCTVACVTALVGYAALIRRPMSDAQTTLRNAGRECASKLLLLSATPLALMPLFGARNFPYYVVTWYPYIGMLSVLSSFFFVHIHHNLQRALALAPIFAIVFPLALAAMDLRDQKNSGYAGDGRAEVVRYLKSHMKPQDTVYVWAYRLDVYAELGRLAAFPFANRIIVHPDHMITSASDRARHVYPEYEQQFFTLLESAPPTFVITFDRNNLGSAVSRANDQVAEMLRQKYQSVFQIEKTDFLNAQTRFEVFQKVEASVAGHNDTSLRDVKN